MFDWRYVSILNSTIFLHVDFHRLVVHSLSLRGIVDVCCVGRLEEDPCRRGDGVPCRRCSAAGAVGSRSDFQSKQVKE